MTSVSPAHAASARTNTSSTPMTVIPADIAPSNVIRGNHSRVTEVGVWPRDNAEIAFSLCVMIDESVTAISIVGLATVSCLHLPEKSGCPIATLLGVDLETTVIDGGVDGRKLSG